MMQKSRARRVTGALADATGRSDEELRLALTVTAIATGLFAALRLLKWLGDLGSNVLGHSRGER
jgi:hypothetical protein